MNSQRIGGQGSSSQKLQHDIVEWNVEAKAGIHWNGVRKVVGSRVSILEQLSQEGCKGLSKAPWDWPGIEFAE